MTLSTPVEQKAKVLHVKVVDNSKDGGPSVNIKMPMTLVKFGLNMAMAFNPDMKNVDIDWDEVTTALEQSKELGKIVEVQDEVQKRTVEVWVE